ncbi:hypothetical protein BT63DRAFT_173845 [Microthyrium microscopicum]|uniref:Uncharacterized protein n=1 Tax=Microthyrium microscopicum TaxID=703497 RepID=A0A6A6UKI8_9PEZI|nr:hypothetical protein BT63DRAFT_173845 [Microthyrium microscopicum]
MNRLTGWRCRDILISMSLPVAVVQAPSSYGHLNSSSKLALHRTLCFKWFLEIEILWCFGEMKLKELKKTFLKAEGTQQKSRSGRNASRARASLTLVPCPTRLPLSIIFWRVLRGMQLSRNLTQSLFTTKTIAPS